MAVFEQEYYIGSDRYSDGDIEDTILSIVEQGRNWKEMKHIPYPVLYHLSEERENILSWYPFRKNCRILEVGSGCGAITGLLCRRGKEVVSVELSKRRGWINYNRNKAYENLTIRIGNLNDMLFEEPFDYVVLNGVFEYAASFTEGEHPYETFLNRIKSYCKQDGHVLIAIENRLGLKYFSGASEDHTNVHFLGLNEYEGNHTVRTFSRSEMEELAARCELHQADFYYPYPDYKFPVEIYTDATINGGNYGHIYANLSEDRCLVFDEHKMARTLCREKVMGSFANSFLVDLSRTKRPADQVIYAKMCSGRHKAFQIQTCICSNEEGDRYVEKGPLNAQATAHVEHIKEAEKVFGENNYKVLNSTWKGKNLRYPYLKEKSVQEVLKDCLRNADQKLLCREMERVFNACVPQGEQCEYQTEAFYRMFGYASGEKSEECVKPANVDLIFDNVFQFGDGYTVIDPEWWVEFPVPRKYLLWRALNEFYCGEATAEYVWPRNDCMKYFSITQQQQETYRAWAMYFAEHYVGQSVTDRCAKPVRSMRLDQWMQKLRMCSSLYLDTGSGFCENEKIAVESYCDEGRFELRFDLSKYKKIQALREELVERTGIRRRIERIHMEETGAQRIALPLNGIREGDEDVFFTLDPQYSIEGAGPEGWNGVLLISGKMEYLDPVAVFAHNQEIYQKNQDAYIRALGDEKLEKEHLNNELLQMRADLESIQQQMNETRCELTKAQLELEQAVSELAWIKSTKWWKIYSKIKHT